MHCVDYLLRPVPTPDGWNALCQKRFICHECERLFAGSSEELYYFLEMDLLYHGHADGVYWRALEAVENGSVRITFLDSVDENVLQRFAIRLTGTGDLVLDGSKDEMYQHSKRFFESMRRQRRDIVSDDFELRFS